MPQSRERKTEYMRDYMARQRGTNNVTDTALAVSPSPVSPLARRQELRGALISLEQEYLVTQARAGDGTDQGSEYRRINTTREPLFQELWELEKGLPADQRYWYPSRIDREPQPKMTARRG